MGLSVAYVALQIAPDKAISDGDDAVTDGPAASNDDAEGSLNRRGDAHAHAEDGEEAATDDGFDEEVTFEDLLERDSEEEGEANLSPERAGRKIVYPLQRVHTEVQ